jgi:hypothetical protein
MSKLPLIFVHNTDVIPAKAGIHLSTVPGADKWIPAFAGMTIYFCCLPAMLIQEGGRR